MKKYMELMLNSLEVNEELKRDMIESLIEEKVISYIGEKTRGIGKTTIIKFLSETFDLPVITDSFHMYRENKNIDLVNDLNSLRGRKRYALLDFNVRNLEEKDELINLIEETGIIPIGIICVHDLDCLHIMK